MAPKVATAKKGEKRVGKAKSGTAETAKRRRGKRKESYAIYIYKVLKQVHHQLSLCYSLCRKADVFFEFEIIDEFNGAETNCRIAHILGILLINSCNTDNFLATTIICSLSALNCYIQPWFCTLVDGRFLRASPRCRPLWLV